MTQLPDTGVTPTRPNLNFALWADRVLAALIDGLINLAVAIVVLVLVYLIGFLIAALGGSVGAATNDGAQPGNPNPIAGLIATGGCCFCFCGPLVLVPISTFLAGLYNKVYLVNRRGCSVGQGAMKLRVVGEDGEKVPLGKLFLRLFVQVGFGFVPLLPLLSILWPLWDPCRQALHDKAVGTYVIKVT